MKDTCHHLEKKPAYPSYQNKLNKHTNKSSSTVEVHTSHFNSCEYTFPSHLLVPNDLLKALGHINGMYKHIFV